MCREVAGRPVRPDGRSARDGAHSTGHARRRTATAGAGAADDEEAQARPGHRGAAPARRALDAIRHGVDACRDGVAAAAEPIVDRVGQAIDGVERSWSERPGARVRRVRRMGARPLAYLYDVHPDARLARPVQVGTRTIDVADIAGTAVGGGDQRGGDFLPAQTVPRPQLDGPLAATPAGAGSPRDPAADRRRQVRGSLLGRRRPQPRGPRPVRRSARDRRRTWSSSSRRAASGPSRSCRSRRRPPILALVADRRHRPSTERRAVDRTTRSLRFAWTGRR